MVIRFTATCCFLLFAALQLCAQAVLSGKVTDKETHKPLAGASVFLSNTSAGTVTGSDGSFSLPPLTPGKYDLVVSAIGYETYVNTIAVSASKTLPEIALQPKVNELQAVVVEAYEKDGWKKWGKFFTEQFIGTSYLASQCRIRNYQVVRFRNSKKNHTLQAFANEPLIIENNALGYTIKFQLESFTYHFDKRMLLYVGFPLFEEKQGRRGQMRRWQSRRDEVYYGSMMHFMRSLYRNRLQEEQFRVYRLKKIPATPQQRAMDLLDTTQLTGDSIAYAIDSTTAGVSFPDYLQVVYTGRDEPDEYLMQIFPTHKKGYITSQITLQNSDSIEVFSNGSYYNPVNLMSSGFWGWAEKMCTLLPVDFKPQKPPR